jgi:hypothetical protein
MDNAATTEKNKGVEFDASGDVNSEHQNSRRLAFLQSACNPAT